MRHAALIILTGAVLLAGCSHPGIRRNLFRAQGGQELWRQEEARRGMQPQQQAPPARQEMPGQASLGVTYGRVFDSGGSAIQGFTKTEFDDADMLCVSFAYLSSRYAYPDANMATQRTGLELRYEDFRSLLHYHSENFGVLRAQSGIVSYKYLMMPPMAGMMGYHVDIGAGFSDTSFNKLTEWRQRQVDAGTYTRIKTGNATIFSGGLGVDFFIEKNVALSFSYRFEYMFLPVKWETDGVKIGKIDKFDVSNHQFSVGVHFYF
jgi:hypothetical protein